VLFDVQDADRLSAELDETLRDVGDGIESSYQDPVEKRDVGVCTENLNPGVVVMESA
jgi:hypothetical protein